MCFFVPQKGVNELAKREEEILNGCISAVHRDRYEVLVDKEQLYAKLKTGVFYKENTQEQFPTVGDQVELQYVESGDSLIIHTKKRKSYFSRVNPTPGMGEQVVAANFDYVFIMMSLNYDYNIKRLERYLTAAWQSGAVPVVILTKADIGSDIEDKQYEIEKAACGVQVYVVSAISGEGMEEIRKYLKPDTTIVFLGSSGVGKSTFTNCLLGADIMDTQDTREEDSKGHHTTTHRQLFELSSGTRIIDTPGMRELGMWDVTEGLGQSFEDVEGLIHQCRFKDCTHTKEPGCAVRKALEEGTLDEMRFRSYK